MDRWLISNPEPYQFNITPVLRMKANRCGPETDPVTKAIEKNEFIASNREDIPAEFKKIPIKLYLESLSNLYPEIITVS